VARDEVEQQPYVASVQVGDERVEIVERAEDRVDAFVVRDVVTVVRHRRREDRGQPDGVDAEVLEVVELRTDTRQVADAVAV
jgi:hypothetical protein